MDKTLGFRREHVGRAVGRALWLFEEQVLDGLRAQGFSDFRTADAQLIRCLPAEGGARMVELAARAQMSKQGMGKLVASMETRRYVERCPDVDDGRAQRVMLARRGRALLRAAGLTVGRLEKEWAEIIGKRAFEQLKKDLLKIVDALGPPDYL